MALSDCPKCWNGICDCGHEYQSWSEERLEAQIAMLQGVLEDKRQAKIVGKEPKPAKNSLWRDSLGTEWIVREVSRDAIPPEDSFEAAHDENWTKIVVVRIEMKNMPENAKWSSFSIAMYSRNVELKKFNREYQRVDE